MFDDVQVWGVLADRYCKLTMLMYAFLGRALKQPLDTRNRETLSFFFGPKNTGFRTPKMKET